MGEGTQRSTQDGSRELPREGNDDYRHSNAQASITAPAGIRQALPIHRQSRRVEEWDHRAPKGLVYVVTDRGSLKQWLHTMRRADTVLPMRGHLKRSAPAKIQGGGRRKGVGGPGVVRSVSKIPEVKG